MLTEIITIGDEILIGQIVDTNSAWMGQQLSLAGIKVKQITSVSDDRSHILEALKSASQRADLILITGGLGPTKDDITKKTLAEYFNCGLRTDEGALENVKRIFSRQDRPILDVNLKQAEVLEICETLLNLNGTAPGMWIEQNKKIYVSLPGVPFEMKYLMEEAVIPRVKSTFHLPSIIHHTILTAGLGESMLAERISSIENDLPDHIKLAYLPKLGLVRLRLSGTSNFAGDLLEEIKVFADKIVLELNEYVICQTDIPLEKAVLQLMEEKNLSLSLAESCTGGFISQLITQHAGSSKVFAGGAVTYSNALKESILGVKPSTLAEWGAVSENTANEMAEGARERFRTDYSIAVTGIAGPDGGSLEKPVGTVWVAVSGPFKTLTKRFQFGSKRPQNIERSSINALAQLYFMLRSDTE